MDRTHDSIEELRGCFEATNWDVFTDNCTDPDQLVDTVTSQVKFCEETVIKTKSVYIYISKQQTMGNQRLKGTPESKETLCQFNYVSFFEG